MGKPRYSDADERASRSRNYRRPAIATAVLLALLSLFFWAGFWQLDRAAQKQALLDNYDAARNSAFISEIVTGSDAEKQRFRHFRLNGEYLPDRQILLDNMTDGGTNGYQVLTPFRAGGRYVLVNRGWIKASADRLQLPDIAVSPGQRTIVARLNKLPAPGLRLPGAATQASSWPRRLLFPTQQQLVDALGLEVPDYQLQLDADQPDGYLRQWKAVDAGPAKHLSYAFQWFSFAALAGIFYCILIFQWLRTQRQSAAAAAAAATHSEHEAQH